MFKIWNHVKPHSENARNYIHGGVYFARSCPPALGRRNFITPHGAGIHHDANILRVQNVTMHATYERAFKTSSGRHDSIKSRLVEWRNELNKKLNLGQRLFN